MAKTTYSSGVTVTSAWLNGAKQIYFDGQDLDWHYNPLGLSSLITGGPDGLDSRYITLATDQPVVQGGILKSGQAISGDKVVTGAWNFGYDQTVDNSSNPDNIAANAPKSYTTNTKYEEGGSTLAAKFAALDDEDLVTKKIVVEQFDDFLADNGYYYIEGSSCNNYSIDGSSTEVCQVL